MSMQKVWQARCEKCTKVSKTQAYKKDLKANLEYWGWHTLEDKHYCPVCSNGMKIPIKGEKDQAITERYMNEVRRTLERLRLLEMNVTRKTVYEQTSRRFDSGYILELWETHFK